MRIIKQFGDFIQEPWLTAIKYEHMIVDGVEFTTTLVSTEHGIVTQVTVDFPNDYTIEQAFDLAVDLINSSKLF